MDFEWGERAERIRGEVKAFLAEHLTPEVEETMYRSGVAHDDDFALALGERHWISPVTPREGFEPLGVAEIHVLTEELTRADAPIYATETAGMVARVISAVGPQWMRDEIVPAVHRGEITIALGMTEPEAGSDVAAIQTRARLEDGEWIVDGQKMFTTNAHLTDYVFLLARTDPSSERHHGLTTFLVPTDVDGYETQAVFTLSGERTNITFFDDLHLDDRWRISEVGAGWRSLMLALQDEHSAPFSPHLARTLEAVERWAHRPVGDGVGPVGDGVGPVDDGSAAGAGARPIDDVDVRRRLASVATTLEVAQLLEQRTSWVEECGVVPTAEGPMSKLFSTEAIVRCAEELCSVVGPDSLRARLDPTSVEDGAVEHLLRFSLGTTIYAGTSEIQRNMIAQRRCGLPR